MGRRKTKNRTGIPRIDGIAPHSAWINFVCVQCHVPNVLAIGTTLPDSDTTFDTASWTCNTCGYVHSKSSDLPFKNWPKPCRSHTSLQAERFWLGFFRIATEHPSSYSKQCNACGRVLPFSAFSRHAKWGPLERQMECRACKGAINAVLNPKRTKQQLHEAAAGRRVAELLMEGENQSISLKELFDRFGAKCFKTGKPLKIGDRKSWAIDHILPSKYLYPLTVSNAALLSREANNNKRDQWPREFYTNGELIELSRITGADLTLLSSAKPVINPKIDVDKCVSRLLKMRERSNLAKRVRELKTLLVGYKLVEKLSPTNRRSLGFK
jgi:hypothetical protein